MTRSALRVVVAVVATVAASFVVVPTAGASRVSAPPAHRTHPTRPARDDARYRPDRVLVKFKDGVSAQRRAESLRGAPAQAVAPSGGVETLAVKNGDVMGEVARLKTDPAVAEVQPDYIRHATGVTPTASQWSQQWDMRKIDAPDAWSVSEGSSAPVVAVIDSGVDYDHPELSPNMWHNPGGLSTAVQCAANTVGYNVIAGNCDPMDDNGHGTHVTGTIGAAGSRVVGINWHVRIMAVKALDGSGDGSDGDLYAAIEWVVQAKASGVDVRAINASWGGAADNPILDGAVRDAHTAGILFVAAAGNAALNNDVLPEYPCASRYALCVTATDSNDNLAVFSNYGRATVALAAPGVDILSTWCEVTGGASACNFHDYAYLDGTSMATPHVTGAAALVSEVTGLTGDALRQRLLSSVDVRPGLVGRVASGGRLNVCRALAANGCAAPVVRATQDGTDVRLQVRAVGPVTSFHVTQWSPSVTSTDVGTGAFRPPPGSFATGAAYVYTVAANNANGPGPPTVVRVTPLKGGYLADGFGGIHAFADAGGVVPPVAHGGPYWGGWNIARGIAVLPSGAGGYVLDGWGGLHPFGVGAQPPPSAARITGWWPNWDIARGVAFTPDGTGGYVVDGYGGLHPFAVGSNPMPPTVRSASYWPGWDIVRGVATVPSAAPSLDAAGGLVLDGYGGIHPFAIGGPGAGLRPTRGPYWKPWDIARGITVSHDGRGGYIGDGWGAIHSFALAALAPPVATPSYWQGWDISRGPAL